MTRALLMARVMLRNQRLLVSRMSVAWLDWAHTRKSCRRRELRRDQRVQLFEKKIPLQKTGAILRDWSVYVKRQRKRAKTCTKACWNLNTSVLLRSVGVWQVRQSLFPFLCQNATHTQTPTPALTRSLTNTRPRSPKHDARVA